MKTILAGAAGLAILAAVLCVVHTPTAPPASNFRTAKVERGDLSRTIHAEGTVKVEQVEIGAQVTGMIAAFAPDPADPSKPVDCGTRVRKGMVLARIDPTIYQAYVEAAEAAVVKAQCNLLQSLARRDQTEQEWKRAQQLRTDRAIAGTDYDVAMANHRVAKANVTFGEAAVHETQAALRIAKTNLEYTVIRSPCDGVIMDRRVNVGQTVVAAFNAPGLFLIAKDSRQVQVWAAVNEADIGRIHLGMPAEFTVSARMDELFNGRVIQIRMHPNRQQNATAYTVVVSAEHCGNLLPDMTARLQFEVERHANVLQIPNDAFDLSPDDVAEIQTAAQRDPEECKIDADDSTPAEPVRTDVASRSRTARRARHRLWIKDGELVRPIDVQTGVSDGSMTEIAGTGVREGLEVVLCTENVADKEGKKVKPCGRGTSDPPE
jgi:HlyD family secretion protein